MSNEFIGNAARLSEADFNEAAAVLDCSVHALRAVAEVESAGSGFFTDGRPKILFERHVFHMRTRGDFDVTHPEISRRSAGGYLGGTREYERLRIAIGANRKAALESTSWGKFQIMGFNHNLVGHPDVETFVKAMVSGEKAQLVGFVAFIQNQNLDGALRRKDWASFARGYNGNSYMKNAYDRKMAAAYARFSKLDVMDGQSMPTLQIGDQGEHVMRLQSLLKIQNPDGLFGSITRAAVMAFQKLKKLKPDGVMGPASWRALHAE